MKFLTVISTLVFAASLSIPVSAKDRDREGSYVEGCLPTVNCAADVKKIAKGKWRLTWTASNRTGTKVYCKHVVDLKVGVGHSASIDEMPDVLVGKLKDGRFLMVDSDANEGTAFLYLDGMPCEGVKLPAGERGIIGFNGIYNMEGDI